MEVEAKETLEFNELNFKINLSGAAPNPVTAVPAGTFFPSPT